ncbi:IS21 family transposase [Pseudarthrobacter sulfonivorans]|uniref:IS21 family transposase n=1 Tax=Pseudarthrobacter sulfonivorans TaxID=121292 RepID=UPI00210250A9|nr:IS21 family transposase [Pseudarthrobacter sulfonivorans]
MADFKAIMTLAVAGRSYDEIVAVVGCSRRDVAAAKKTIAAYGFTAGQIGAMSPQEIARLFPDGRKRVTELYERPDFDRVLASMRENRHFTLQQAWSRYLASAAANGGKKYGYSQYCALFADHARVSDVVATLHHEPGRAMLVDWAGDTLEVVDAVTGEVTGVYLFVAVLPYSGAVFCHGYTDMTSASWIAAHVAAFSFYGGVPQLVVPDNPATSTHRPKRGESARVLNPRYQQLAEHYSTGIVPARVKRPRDKAAAESAVNVVNKRVIGYLAEEVFTTVQALNAAIGARLVEINEQIPRADGSTRWERFTADESGLLQALPADGFDSVEWKQLKVGRNYHVSCDSQHYSVPYTYAGQLLRVRVTSTTVTVFDGDQVICEHVRRQGRKGQYSTDVAHAPTRHRGIDGLWSKRWFTDRARGFGPATEAVIAGIIDRHAVEAQGYLDCQNILESLGKRNKARLEAACQVLLDTGQGPGTYSTIKRIMATIDSDTKKPRTITPAAATRKPAGGADPGAGLQAAVHVRSAEHYRRGGQGGQG